MFLMSIYWPYLALITITFSDLHHFPFQSLVNTMLKSSLLQLLQSQLPLDSLNWLTVFYLIRFNLLILTVEAHLLL